MTTLEQAESLRTQILDAVTQLTELVVVGAPGRAAEELEMRTPCGLILIGAEEYGEIENLGTFGGTTYQQGTQTFEVQIFADHQGGPVAAYEEAVTITETLKQAVRTMQVGDSPVTWKGRQFDQLEDDIDDEIRVVVTCLLSIQCEL